MPGNKLFFSMLKNKFCKYNYNSEVNQSLLQKNNDELD